MFRLSLYSLRIVDGRVSALVWRLKAYVVFCGRTLVQRLYLLKDQIKWWTVGVQRLLQPTRELVRSGYEARVESQGTVITR